MGQSLAEKEYKKTSFRYTTIYRTLAKLSELGHKNRDIFARHDLITKVITLARRLDFGLQVVKDFGVLGFGCAQCQRLIHTTTKAGQKSLQNAGTELETSLSQ